MSFPQNIIGIHGVPRSGTSWLGQIFNSSPNVAFRFQPLFSYAFKDRLNQFSSTAEIKKFFKDIYLSQDDFLLQKDKIALGAYPDFSKSQVATHLVFKHVRYHHLIENLLIKVPTIKIIGIVRHPCAVINSWLQAPKEFKIEWDQLHEWRYAQSKNQNRIEEFYGFERWKEVAEMFLKLAEKYPHQFVLIKYAELNEFPMETVKKLFEFCQLILSEQTIKFIEESTQNDHDDTYAVYRSNRQDNKWQTELNQTIKETIIKEIQKTRLKTFL